MDNNTVDNTISPSTRNSTNRPKKYQRASEAQIRIFFLGLSQWRFTSGSSSQACTDTVPKSTAHRLFKKAGENNGILLAPKRRGRTAPPKLLPEHSQVISAFLETKAEATLEEIKAHLGQAFPEVANISLSVLSKHIMKHCASTLKKAEIYRERRDDPEVRALRKAYIQKIMSSNVQYMNNCVFLDETGFNLHIHRNFARSPRNQPARIKVATNGGTNLTVLAAISNFGTVSVCHNVESGGTRVLHFQQFVINVAQQLHQRGVTHGWYFVYDNAPIHTQQETAELIRSLGFEPSPLPPWRSFRIEEISDS